MFRYEFQQAMDKDRDNELPLASHQPDDLMDKLKLLNYEKTFLKDLKMKPLDHHYFIRSVNPGEQFFMFVSLCAWLIRKTGRNFDQPQEFDDPTTVINSILKVLKELDIPTDFPTNRLIQGAGPICLYIVDCLATQACKVDKSQFEAPTVQPEDNPTFEVIENDSEIILEKLDDVTNGLASDDDSEDEEQSISLSLTNTRDNRKPKNIFTIRNQESNVDNLSQTENWRLEVERVLPQLKVIVKSDPRDWRTHVEHMKTLRDSITRLSTETTTQLNKIQTDIAYEMEKIESREKHLNNYLSDAVQKFKEVYISYNKSEDELKILNREKIEIEEKLAKVIFEFDNVKQEMENRGNTMSDGTPLINIKKAVAKLRDEISQLDLQIAILQHTLDQDHQKQKLMHAENDVNALTVN